MRRRLFACGTSAADHPSRAARKSGLPDLRIQYVPISGKPEMGARPPQRLCFASSGLPLFFISDHGVENGQYLAGDRNERNHFGLTAGEQALVELTQHWVAAGG